MSGIDKERKVLSAYQKKEDKTKILEKKQASLLILKHRAGEMFRKEETERLKRKVKNTALS